MKLLTISLLLFIIGCAGIPIGYGGSYQILYSDEDMIMFTYDSDLTNVGKMMKVAKEHCAKYDKKAVPEPPSAPNWNAVSTFTANCKPK